MKAAVITAWVALAGPAMAAGPQWTWEAGKQTNNGAITVKSTNGSATYSGTQNPTGAVAKVNQTAVTQPPTVIIQATSSTAYEETVPLLISGSENIPICPSGYYSIWSKSGSGCPSYAVFNIKGSRWSFGRFNKDSLDAVGFSIDGETITQSKILEPHQPYCINGNTGYKWAANLCTK